MCTGRQKLLFYLAYMRFIFTGNEIPTVVFNAHSVTTYSPPTGQPVVFTTVISNIGDAYNSSTGKFTAPVNGTYSFTVQLCVYYDKTWLF